MGVLHPVRPVGYGILDERFRRMDILVRKKRRDHLERFPRKGFVGIFHSFPSFMTPIIAEEGRASYHEDQWETVRDSFEDCVFCLQTGGCAQPLFCPCSSIFSAILRRSFRSARSRRPSSSPRIWSSSMRASCESRRIEAIPTDAFAFR